ncbi:hypothetical protein GGI23_003071 [Coemansia sp. RSA 2559]|nr:hypothetical protein GGI23_003071 [Coemansia sp. RSA 2559]KAJ2860535.1 hypothetical protein GGI22_002689 [Coemansia erecta]
MSASTVLSAATAIATGTMDSTPDTTTLLLPTPSTQSLLLPSDNELLDCKLVGAFSLFVQILVGTLGFSTLMIKRYFERPQRTWKVWAFDVSKQMISGALMHMANLLVSALRGSHNGKTDEATNPCSWYVLNLTMDCTVGILFVAMYLRMYERLAMYAGVKELESGDYGTPPSWRRWLKQASVFCASMVSMKLSVVTLIALFPALVVVGDLVLKPVQMTASPRLQIVFVMAFWPLALNIFESWVLDQFIKRKHKGPPHRSASGHVPLPTTEDESADAMHTSYEMEDASNLGSSRTLVGGTRASIHGMDMADMVMPSPADPSNLHSIYKVRTFNDFDTDDDVSTDGYDGGARRSTSSSGSSSTSSTNGRRYSDKPSAQKVHDD